MLRSQYVTNYRMSSVQLVQYIPTRSTSNEALLIQQGEAREIECTTIKHQVVMVVTPCSIHYSTDLNHECIIGIGHALEGRKLAWYVGCDDPRR